MLRAPWLFFSGPPKDWSASEVAAWVKSIGLPSLAPSFLAHDFDGFCLALGLDDDTLTELGVTLRAHRVKLQRAYEDLFAVPEADLVVL